MRAVQVGVRPSVPCCAVKGSWLSATSRSELSASGCDERRVRRLPAVLPLPQLAVDTASTEDVTSGDRLASSPQCAAQSLRARRGAALVLVLARSSESGCQAALLSLLHPACSRSALPHPHVASSGSHLHDRHLAVDSSMPRAATCSECGSCLHSLKRYPIPEMLSALYWMTHLGYGARHAVMQVNHNSRSTAIPPTPPQLLSRSTVHRTFQSLPAELRHPDSCSVAGLLEFMEEQHGSLRVGQQLGTSQLTEEEVDEMARAIQLGLDRGFVIATSTFRELAALLLAGRLNQPAEAAAATAAAAAAAAGDQHQGSGDSEDERENSQPNLPSAPAPIGAPADLPKKYTVAAVRRRRAGAVLRLRAVR